MFMFVTERDTPSRRQQELGPRVLQEFFPSLGDSDDDDGGGGSSSSSSLFGSLMAAGQGYAWVA